MEPIITFKDIWFRYHEESDWILKGIDFTLHRGEWVTILGGNGSGKSTMAKLMNGLLQPTRGEVEVSGFNSKNQDHLWPIRQNVGMVFQNPENQIVAMTVVDDIAFGLENLGVPRDEMEQRIEEVITRLGLTNYRQHEPHKLSGGQKQRLAIAGILAMRPQVVIFDEATSMLDPQGAKDVRGIISSLHQAGISIVQITHEVEEVIPSNRIIVLHRGEIQMSGTPRDILRHSDRFHEYGLIAPFAVRVRDALNRKGRTVNHLLMTDEELVEELCKSASKI